MDDKQILAMLDSFVQENTDALVEDIAALVKHRSVEGPAAGPGAPFGAPVRAALNEALAMARRFGLETGECDGYMGWGEIAGAEKGHIATIAHLDVVPEGGGWDADPYTLRQREGWLLGRGVCDDKGPAALSLYAAKFFKEKGIPLRYGLRVLLGCNEETGMADVEHYLARNEEPLFCFSPDSDFPVCCGEKGIYSGDFISRKIENGNLTAFEGGIAGNVVPEFARCTVKGDVGALGQLPRGIQAQAGGPGLVRLEARGIGGHAAAPQGTKNAILMLVQLLLDKGLCTGQENSFLRLERDLLSTTDGAGAGIACDDGFFTPLTCIGGVAQLKDGVFTQNINIRYPGCTSGEALTAALAAYGEKYGHSFLAGSNSPPYLVPKNSPQVQALLSAYNDIFGEKGEPYTMGGGTYSRHFKNACAFGPEVPGEMPAFAGPIHGANEAIGLTVLQKALKTYILAIWRLQGVSF